jgi:hypothetical protein
VGQDLISCRGRKVSHCQAMHLFPVKERPPAVTRQTVRLTENKPSKSEGGAVFPDFRDELFQTDLPVLFLPVFMRV